MTTMTAEQVGIRASKRCVRCGQAVGEKHQCDTHTLGSLVQRYSNTRQGSANMQVDECICSLHPQPSSEDYLDDLRQRHILRKHLAY